MWDRLTWFVRSALPDRSQPFLQRVGRSGHSVNKTPKGKLFPLTSDELVDCAAIMDAIQHGELDRDHHAGKTD
jgi:ATP-dependent Lhr-like helicase